MKRDLFVLQSRIISSARRLKCEKSWNKYKGAANNDSEERLNYKNKSENQTATDCILKAVGLYFANTCI